MVPEESRPNPVSAPIAPKEDWVIAIISDYTLPEGLLQRCSRGKTVRINPFLPKRPSRDARSSVSLSGTKNSPLPPRFLHRLHHRRENILDHATIAGLDLGGDAHAGAYFFVAAVAQVPFLQQRHLGGVSEFPGRRA